MDGWTRCERCGGPARGDYCSRSCRTSKERRQANLPDHGGADHGHQMTVVFRDDPTNRSDWWGWVCANRGCDLETDHPLTLDDLEPECEGEWIYDG